MDSTTMFSIPSVPDNLPIVNAARYCLGTFAFIGNGFVLLLYVRFASLRRSQCNGLIAIQTVADSLVSVGIFMRATQASISANKAEFVFSKWDCSNLALIQGCGIFAEQVAVLAISVDRFLAIRNPVHYSSSQSKTLFKTCLLACVLASIGYIFVTFYGLDPEATTFNCSAGSSAGPYFSFYLLIFGLVCALFIFIFYLSTVYLVYFKLSTKQKTSNSSKIQLRVFTSISLMLISYGLFWCIPLAFLFSSKLVKYDNTTVGIITTGFGFGSIVNACLNVVWYTTKHPDIKKCAKQLLSKSMKRVGLRIGSVVETHVSVVAARTLTRT